MGAVDGLTVLREFKRMSPDTAVVVLTSFGSLEGAIEAIKQGAYDYLAKPFKKDDITLVVKRSLDHCRLIRENARFREELKSKDEWSPLVGSSPAMLEVYKLVARVTESKSTVLLQGESGTGKELIARAIHANGPRRDKPFIPVNCGALPDTLLESEMFGYEKGAFTGAVGNKAGLFESANGGTLFLDEIGEIGQTVQVKLLRVMQDHEVRRVGSTTSTKVDVRIIAAEVSGRLILSAQCRAYHLAVAGGAAGGYSDVSASLLAEMRGGGGTCGARGVAGDHGVADAVPVARQCARVGERH
jgi:DNA-binding NtrC family response regulator